MTADNPEREPAPDAAPKRGRKPGYKMTQEHRDKIANSKLLNRLLAYFEGSEFEGNKIDLSQGQVTVGMGLLKKYLPDQTTTTLQGDEDGGPIEFDGRIELVAPSLNDKT
jgi:hypothetical protein